MFIIALTPIVGTSFPALVPAILSVAGALGYRATTGSNQGGQLNKKLRQQIEERTNVTLRVDEIVFEAVEEEVARAESIYLEKDDIVLGIIKDERNRLRIEVSGPKGIDPKLLERQGQEFMEEVAQMFAQNRAVEQIERLNAEVAEEVREENGEIRLTIRRWT